MEKGNAKKDLVSILCSLLHPVVIFWTKIESFIYERVVPIYEQKVPIEKCLH